jgi:signal transduction histidine kinase
MNKLGMIGMQERAELLGGKLEVQSSPKKGVTVSVTIPDYHSTI